MLLQRRAGSTGRGRGKGHALCSLSSPACRLQPSLNGSILCGQPKGVPAHGVQDSTAPHAVEVGQAVADGVDSDMTHVKAPRGVGEHGQDVELVSGRSGGRLQEKTKMTLIISN